MIRLDKYCESVRDGTHDTPKPTTEGKYLVTSKAINNDTIDYSSAYYISEKDFNIVNKRSKVDKYDVLMTMIGSVGRLHLVDYEPNYAIKNIALFKIGDYYKAKWLYYYMSSNNVQNYLEAVANGTSQHFVGLGYLRKFKIEDINEDKKRIVDILTNYDNLIKINNKRIAILEQIAEEIYKEWFVRFKFPECKNYCFTNAKPYGWIYGNKSNMSIPSNWHFGRLDEIGKFVRGKNITSTEMIDGEIPVVSAGIEPSGYHNEANVKGKSLTMSASGANAGYLKYNLNDIWAADCSYYQNDENIWFVYSSLKFIESAIKNLQVGSAQPHVYAKNINKLNIIIPEEKYIKMYNDLVNPMFEEIRKLYEKNKILVKQRGLLSPRLMSGKLEVK